MTPSLFVLPSPIHPISLSAEPLLSIDLVYLMRLTASLYRLYIIAVCSLTELTEYDVFDLDLVRSIIL